MAACGERSKDVGRASACGGRAGGERRQGAGRAEASGENLWGGPVASGGRVRISILEISRGKAKIFHGLETHRFKTPSRQFSNLSDLWYLLTLDTFLSYKRSLLRTYGSAMLRFDLQKKQ